MREAINKQTVIGTLADVAIDRKTSAATAGKPSVNYLIGKFTVKVVRANEEQLIDIAIKYTTEMTKAGAQNKNYATLIKLADQVGRRVSVTCELEENKFVNQDKLIKTNRLTMSFINFLTATDVKEDEATFDVEGFVVEQLHPAMRRKNDETYISHYEMKIAQANWTGKLAKVLTFAVDVENQAAIDFITNNYLNGNTVRLFGNIDYQVETVTTTQEVDFGAPITRTYQNTLKLFKINKGNKDETKPFTGEEIDELVKSIAVNDSDVLEASKKSSQGASTPTAANAPSANAINAAKNFML